MPLGKFKPYIEYMSILRTPTVQYVNSAFPTFLSSVFCVQFQGRLAHCMKCAMVELFAFPIIIHHLDSVGSFTSLRIMVKARG